MLSAVVTAAPPRPAEQAARRVHAPGASGWPALTGLRNLDLEAPAARPLALALGGALGGMVSLVANVISPLPSLVLGALLGETSWLLSRAERWDIEQHAQRVKLIQAYPDLRALAAERGVCYDDRDQVRRIHDVLQERMSHMVAGYREHCELRNLPRSEVLDNVLKAFYLSHCKDRPPAVITCVRSGDCVLAAVTPAEMCKLEHAVHEEGRAPDAVLREMKRVFLRVDRLGNTLRHARAFRVERDGIEWKVTATATPDAQPLVDCYAPSAGPVVQLTRHVRTGRVSDTASSVPCPLPARSPAPTPARACRVDIGQTLAGQLTRLSTDSATRRCVERLQSDLEQGRQRGHVVDCGGQSYIAIDANMDGVRGRGVWRVLYQRHGDAFTLVGIGDYHHRRDRPISWW